MIFLLRRLWYLARRALLVLYKLLHFFGKPGSRWLMPIAAAALAFFARDPLHQVMADAYRTYDPRSLDPLLLDLVMGAGWIAFSLLYWLLSRVLEVILGTFPMMAHPLPPQRPLKAATAKKEIGRAVVRVAVPSLPRRRVVPSSEPPRLTVTPPAVVRLIVPPLPRRVAEVAASQAAAE